MVYVLHGRAEGQRGGVKGTSPPQPPGERLDCHPHHLTLEIHFIPYSQALHVLNTATPHPPPGALFPCALTTPPGCPPAVGVLRLCADPRYVSSLGTESFHFQLMRCLEAPSFLHS